MFIFTWRFTKLKAVIFVLLLAVVICALVLIAGSGAEPAEQSDQAVSAAPAALDGNDARVAYLEALGWQVEPEPLEEQTIVIPRQFDGVYSQYHELQLKQGFDLSPYAGLEARRYTYTVLNYPGCAENVVADLIIYRSAVIAGDIHCTALDGFMEGLEYPSE